MPHFRASFRATSALTTTDLDVDATDRVLMLNVLRELNKNFKHLRMIFTHATPFPSF
jgi:hypothetical protein